MKSFKSLLILMLFSFCVVSASAQKTVRGRVSDTAGEPLIGVNVIVKGSTIGTVTNVDGGYSLQVPGNDATLVFSYIGYTTVEVAIGNQTVINQTLTEDRETLDELIVVGYGTQKKVTVTGSVASVSGTELKASPTTNLSNGMLGRLPGVIGFTREGEPGSGGTTIRIRGTNSLGSKDPLVVIDGVADRSGGFNRLNPSEIESISVLKDAAASIYGSRAANGVILITTKRGKEGKPVVTLEGSYGFSQPIRLPKMANSFEYATMLNEITPGTYTDDELRKFQDGSDPWGYPNTNWYDAIKSVSPIYRTDVGVSGGSDKMKYYVNLSANGEDGIYKRSANRYDQYGIRLNLDIKTSNYVSFTYGNESRIEYRQYPAKSAGSIFSALRRGKPIYNAVWPTGEPGPDIEYGDNPYVTATDAAGFDRQKTYFIQNNVGVNIDIPWVEGLKLQGNAAYDKRFWNRKLFQKPVILYSWDGVTKSSEGLSPAQRWIGDPRMERANDDQTDWLTNAILSYDKTLNSHTFGIMAGVEAQSKELDYFWAFRRYFISDQVTEIDAGSSVDMNNAGSSWKENRLNYFGRLNYNFLERYLFEFVWRYDGSYRFPKEKRYGFFPGISAAWRASEENFWKNNIGFIDYFKLRASIAQTGNDALLDSGGNYDRSIQYLNTFGLSGGPIFGTGQVKGIYPSRTPNPNITWERGTTYNIGFDFKFLQNRLTWETDLFYHKRTDMLISRNASLSEIAGITLPRENLGEMENKGIESLLSWSDKIGGDFQYDLSLNMTYTRNKILFWDETPGIPDYQKSTGMPVNSPLWYVADGIFHNQAEIDAYPHWSGARPGDIRFKDVNDDGQINADDRVRRNKTAEPWFVGGFNVTLKYKNWDLMALFQSALGAEIYIQTWSGTVGNFLKDYYDNRWTPENPNAKGPRTYERENQYWISNWNSYFIRSGDYLRLKNMELGYTISNNALKKSGIQQIRLYTNGSNIFTLDKLKVFDPEANDASLVAYPQRRYFNFGISATF